MARLTIQQAFYLAVQHHQAGRLHEAEQLYRKILAQQPEHSGATHYLGMIAHQLGRNDAAVELIRRAIALGANSAEAYSTLGNALKAKGELDEAIAAYRQALAFSPDLPEAQSNLGAALQAKGQLDEAIAAYRQALVLEPNYAEAHNNLGTVLIDKGQPDEAIASYRQAIALKPAFSEAHSNLGIALQAQGQLDEAIAAYRQAIALKPNSGRAFSNLGAALQAKGQLDQAITACRQAIALNPNLPEGHSNLGNALIDKGRLDEAVAACRRALALNPNLPEVHNNLGNALQATRQVDEAISAYRQAIVLKPGFAEAHCNLGNVLKDAGHPDDAIAAYRQAISLRPNYAEAHNNLGSALQIKGQLDEAIAAFRQAIALKPEYVEAHRNLAQARRFTAADPQLTAMENLASDMASLSENDRIALHFALGKAYGDLEQHERAFGHLLEGNALKRRQIRYDEAAEGKWFDRIKAVFTPELMQEKKGLGDPSDLPVFILGMPRSGTTLIEQVLASHPKVFGAGELREMVSLVTEVNRHDHGPARFPEVVRLLGQEELRGLGARYVRNISALAPAAAPDTGRMPVPLVAQRITDKMPDNFRFAGFIHLALPRARIIHARRDPVDTCLSCFSHLFAKGTLEWSYDLGELGRYYRAYAAMMDHWRQVLGDGVMLDVQYEDLVTDFEPQARRMIAFCGLEWNDRCLAFHETKRPVRTASSAQVRQPIYRSSIGRWRPQEHRIRPLLDELRI